MRLVGSAPEPGRAVPKFARMNEVAGQHRVVARFSWKATEKGRRENRNVAESSSVSPANRGLLGNATFGFWIKGLFVANFSEIHLFGGATVTIFPLAAPKLDGAIRLIDASFNKHEL